MATTAPKVKFVKSGKCVACAKLIFHFEGSVNVTDLNPQERTVCASLTGRGDQKESKDILCVSCYCKLQQDHKESVDSGNVAKNQVSQQDNSGQESPCHWEIQTESPRPPGNLQRSLSELHQSECSGSQTTPPQIKHVPEAALLLQREGSGSRQELVKSTTNSSTFMKFVNQALTPTIVGSVVAGVTVAVMEFVFGWHWAVVLAGLLSLVVYAVGKYHPAVQRFFCTGAESIGNTATNPATSITAGTSLEGTSTLALLQDGYRVTCGVEVENWTCHPLTLPHVQLGRGTLTLAPSAVAPATREVMVARKISGLAEGTFGTVSWLIQPMNRRLVVMWSAPFNFNHFSNWLGVGLTGEDVIAHAPGNDWFDQMYYGESTPQLQFERGEYYADIRPVVCRDADFEVEGIMGSDHKAVVKVILRPRDPKNFARSIKEKMKVA